MLTTTAKAKKRAAVRPLPKYAFIWKQIRRPDGRVDMEQFLRRLTRLEAGILDVLPRARAEHVRRKTGLPYESLSEDVAQAIGMRRPGHS